MKQLFSNILKSQQGVAVVMFAFILPLLILAAGISVDFGNVYFHKSQLQNMTDAAILASAKEYENNPQSSDLSQITDEYIEKNLKNNPGFNNPIPATNPYPVITHKDNSTKLQLTLTENVPLYFFRVFGYNEMKISARSTALVASESGWPFKDLITFSQSMNVNQGHQNNVYNTTFDGNIRFIPPHQKTTLLPKIIIIVTLIRKLPIAFIHLKKYLPVTANIRLPQLFLSIKCLILIILPMPIIH
ncbi:pilus assembly protein TadG-related protein [Pectinatus brassicae]|uniref:Flp pilus assembly protein TadG n=1 Tax=Pectinatus brassicae TaxID=862415 RepID=A0A840UHQ8_9FIRM|nr:pilus assembly protein TadG-related protein [Pectinatus brassicae]MBB5335077.1 Flp pilus assembly protein TadG [Pectinatus brassicae]